MSKETNQEILYKAIDALEISELQKIKDYLLNLDTKNILWVRI